MLDYGPIVLTFILAVLGVIAKTTRDSDDAPGKKSKIAPAGWVVLVLLVLSLLFGLITANDSRSEKSEGTERYHRDSTTWAKNLAVAEAQRDIQKIALDESRSATTTQVRLLNSSLDTSRILARSLRSLADSLREQGAEASRTAAAQQRLVQSETDRLRNLIGTARGEFNFVLPPFARAKANALRSLVSIPLPDSVRRRWRQAIVDTEVSDSGIIATSSGNVQLLFPPQIVVTMWPAMKNGACDYEEWWNLRNVVQFSFSTASPSARWNLQSMWSEDRPLFHLDWTDALVNNQGISSFAELRGGCFRIHLTPSLEQIEWPSDDRRELFKALWAESTIVLFTLDFGGGRLFWRTSDSADAPTLILDRIPSRLPWEPVSSAPEHDPFRHGTGG